MEFKNPLESKTVGDLMVGIINFLFTIGIPIAIAAIVYSGVLFLVARGNPASVTKAKTVLIYAVIGLSIILIGKGFLTLINSILELSNG